MRLLIFIAVIVGIALIFGAVYGISALVERKRSGRGGSAGRPGNRGRTVTKTTAPDDDPEFLRNLARRLAEEERLKNKAERNKNDESGEASNDK